MRPFEEMSDEEVLVLTEEEIERQIDYECALEGIPLLPALPSEPTKPEAQQDLTAYAVAGVLLKDEQLARDLAKHVQGLPGRVKEVYLDSSYHVYDQTIKPDDSTVSVTTKQLWSREAWAAVGEEHQAHEAAKARYDEAQTEYDNINRERSTIKSKIYNRVNDVQRAADRRNFLSDEFDRYRDLADSDIDIAAKFLIDAYPEVRGVEGAWTEHLPPVEESVVDESEEEDLDSDS